MIYTDVTINDPICQGDIFHNLPFVRFNLMKLQIYDEEEEKFFEDRWDKTSLDDILILANLQKTYSIVFSQDCDCSREEYISLFVIKPWGRNFQTPKRWMEEIVKINTKGPSTMYLPLDDNYKIPERMIIEFAQVFNLRRENLESLRDLRLCKLNKEAMEHFREKMAYYFHRYSYLEHYPLNGEEMNEFVQKNPKEENNRREYQKL